MEPRHQNAEEIDLLYFFNPLFRGAKKMGRGVKNYLRLLLRNGFLFLGIFIILAALGYALRYVLPKSYKTSAIFASYNLPANWCATLVNSLNDMKGRDGKAQALAGELKISPAAASAIQSISADTMENLNELEYKDSAAATFKVNLRVSDEKAIPEIQNGLQNYVESNPFSLKRKQVRQKKLEALRQDLVMRINDMDSLRLALSKNIVYSTSKPGFILGVPVSPVEVYKAQQEYYEQEKQLEEKLALLQNIEVLQPFTRPPAPNYPNFTRLFAYAVLIGLLAALLLTPLLGRRKF